MKAPVRNTFTIPKPATTSAIFPRARPLKTCPMIGAARNAALRKIILRSWTIDGKTGDTLDQQPIEYNYLLIMA